MEDYQAIMSEIEYTKAILLLRVNLVFLSCTLPKGALITDFAYLIDSVFKS